MTVKGARLSLADLRCVAEMLAEYGRTTIQIDERIRGTHDEEWCSHVGEKWTSILFCASKDYSGSAAPFRLICVSVFRSKVFISASDDSTVALGVMYKILSLVQDAVPRWYKLHLLASVITPLAAGLTIWVTVTLFESSGYTWLEYIFLIVAVIASTVLGYFLGEWTGTRFSVHITDVSPPPTVPGWMKYIAGAVAVPLAISVVAALLTTTP